MDRDFLGRGWSFPPDFTVPAKDVPPPTPTLKRMDTGTYQKAIVTGAAAAGPQAPPFEEEKLLRVAYMYEQQTDWHRQRPPLGA